MYFVSLDRITAVSQDSERGSSQQLLILQIFDPCWHEKSSRNYQESLHTLCQQSRVVNLQSRTFVLCEYDASPGRPAFASGILLPEGIVGRGQRVMKAMTGSDDLTEVSRKAPRPERQDMAGQ